MLSRKEQAGWNEFALAVVGQAVQDWRDLCKGKRPETQDCNFAELDEFFQGGCGFYLLETGISANRIYSQLCRERKRAEKKRR